MTIAGIRETRQYTIQDICAVFRAVNQHFSKNPAMLKVHGLFRLSSTDRQVQALITSILSGTLTDKFASHDYINALKMVIRDKKLLNHFTPMVQLCYQKLKSAKNLENAIGAVNALVDSLLKKGREDDRDTAEIFYTFFQIASKASRYALTNRLTTKNIIINDIANFLFKDIFSGDIFKFDDTDSNLQSIIESYNFILPFELRANLAQGIKEGRVKLTAYEGHKNKEKTLLKEASCSLPMQEYGTFVMKVFQGTKDGREHFAMIKGPINPDMPVVVRMHSECMTGDTFGSLRCDCGPQLQAAMRYIGENGGILLYLRQEGRGIGLFNKINAYTLQEHGRDTVEANVELGFAPDQRDFTDAAQILSHLGVKKIKLLTNNPLKIESLKKLGIEVVGRVSLEMTPSPCNQHYMETKREKMGHMFTFKK